MSHWMEFWLDLHGLQHNEKDVVVTGSRMLWFARASVGLAGFLWEILVALKKTFPLQFSLILGICIP